MSILFKPQHVAPIIEREKCATRRLGDRRWRVGARRKCYTVPPFQGGIPFATVEIMAVYVQRLGAMKRADARAEGYPSMVAFAKAWRGIHGSWNPRSRVWVVEFTLLEVHVDHDLVSMAFSRE